jgi:hypothetical protein
MIHTQNMLYYNIMSVTISNDTPMSLSNSVSYDTHDRTCYTTYIMSVTISNDTPCCSITCSVCVSYDTLLDSDIGVSFDIFTDMVYVV